MVTVAVSSEPVSAPKFPVPREFTGKIVFSSYYWLFSNSPTLAFLRLPEWNSLSGRSGKSCSRSGNRSNDAGKALNIGLSDLLDQIIFKFRFQRVYSKVYFITFPDGIAVSPAHKRSDFE